MSKTKWISYDHWHCETQHISGWGCIHMTASHNRTCWNTLYMHEADLLWVWSEWGAAIITCSMIRVKNQVNFLRPLRLWDLAYITLGLHPYYCQPQHNVLKHFIFAWSRPTMSMKWVGCRQQFSYNHWDYEPIMEDAVDTSQKSAAVPVFHNILGRIILWNIVC